MYQIYLFNVNFTTINSIYMQYSNTYLYRIHVQVIVTTISVGSEIGEAGSISNLFITSYYASWQKYEFIFSSCNCVLYSQVESVLLPWLAASWGKDYSEFKKVDHFVISSREYTDNKEWEAVKSYCRQCPKENSNF